MAGRYFSGFESGGTSELPGWNVGFGTAAVQSTVVRSGAYALNLPPNGSTGVYALLDPGFSLPTAFVRVYFRFDALPNPDAGDDNPYFQLNAANGNTVLSLRLGFDGTTDVYGNQGAGSPYYGTCTTIMVPNTWYCVEVMLAIGAGNGRVEIKFDSVLDSSVGSLTNNADGNFTEIEFDNFSNGFSNFYYDDLAVDDAAYCGQGKIIARQFKAGTPTYNSWTKIGSSTIDVCWGDTPVGTSKAASTPSQTAAIAQSALTASFSTTQTGHGTDVIGANDTINGIKVGGIAKCSSTANSRNLGSIRARFGGADKDTNVTLTTADAYYETAAFVDTLANLNASEAGWNKRASTTAGTQTVEDMWVMVLYAPSVNLSATTTLGALTASAQASVSVDASASANLAAMTVAASASVGVDASASITLSPLTVTASASVPSVINATADITFAPMTATASASAPVNATADITLAALTVSAAATNPDSATAAITLAPLTVASALSVSVNANAAANLAALTVEAVASVTNSINASASITFAPLTMDSAASASVDASVNITFAALTGDITLSVPNNASGSPTLGLLSTTASASVPVQAEVSVTFAPLSVQALLVPVVGANVNITFGALSVEAVAENPVSAEANFTFDALTVSAVATNPDSVSVDITFEPLTVAASLGNPVNASASIALDALRVVASMRTLRAPLSPAALMMI